MNTEKILVIQTSFIGDAILTLPMLEKLKELYPKSIITVLTIPSTEIIFTNSHFVNEVIVYDKRNKDKGLLNLLKLGLTLRSKNFTKLFSPHRSFRTSILVFLARVFESSGFDISSLKYVYKNIIKYKLDEHEVLRNFRLIGYNIEGDNWKVLPKLNIPKETIKNIAQFVKDNKLNKYICVAPGSVWETKKYPEKYYKEIIKFIINLGYKVVLIGSNKEYDTCNSLSLGLTDKVFNTAGKFTIIETIELIKNSSMIICNDSAPTHFAMVADVSVITLYCSTIPEFGFYPYSEKSSYLSISDIKCKPCGIHGYKMCPINNFECAEKLHPSIVNDEIVKLLERN